MVARDDVLHLVQAGGGCDDLAVEDGDPLVRVLPDELVDVLRGPPLCREELLGHGRRGRNVLHVHGMNLPRHRGLTFQESTLDRGPQR